MCGDSANNGEGSKIGTCDSRCKCNLNWTGFHTMVLVDTTDTNGNSTKTNKGFSR